MKTQAGWIVAVFAVLVFPARADIVTKAVKSASGQVATGYVLQGSYKMRGLGKRRVSVSAVPSVRVMSNSGVSVSAQTVIPVLQNSQLRAKPRFGYGSDYQGAGAAQPVKTHPVPPVIPTVPKAAPKVVTHSSTTVLRAQPIYAYSYRPREYYPVWGRCVNYGRGTFYGSAR